jgi:hypothetical protein
LAARKAASEAPTEPPPPPSGSSGAPKSPRVSTASPRVSAVRPKKRGPNSAVVDEVTADLSHDPRRDEDD